MPWNRQANEPNLWFHRFDEYYRKQGPERTLLGAINLWREEKGQKRTTNIGQAWQTAAADWRWKHRAEKWDEWRLEKSVKDEHDDWERRREARKKLLEVARAKAFEALDALEVGELSAREVTDLIKAVLQQERAEWEATPSAELQRILNRK